jgi:ABC-type transporter Mla MlaB component
MAYPEPLEDTWVLPPWHRSYSLEEVLPRNVGEVDSTGLALVLRWIDGRL